MKFASLLSTVALAAVIASAHPGPHVHMSREELNKRQLAARERHLKARNCAADIASFNARRKLKRSTLAKRQTGKGRTKSQKGNQLNAMSSVTASSTSSAAAPHYTSLQNTTCIMAPEVTEGPYYINNELRPCFFLTSVSSLSGVPLVLDIGVMDVTTCTPLDNVFVEIWAANATGVYSGYGGAGGMSGGPPADAGNSTEPSSMSMSAPPTSMSVPSGGMGDGPGGGSASLARNETFLRGGWPTNSEGIVELKTIYPGFYSGRTAHIHTMIHMNWTESANGTLVSHAGSLLHIGQMFFEESWNEQVYALSPYTDNTENSRTYNDEDNILEQENADGNSAYLALELLGDSIEDGILGYITIGVNSSASYSITNTNYLNSTGSA
uniref:Aromatic compound dioxygenase n=1 Tax=Moniliophthora roreri TaxID=221103 RepID=A0A0W0F7Q7_MONRR